MSESTMPWYLLACKSARNAGTRPGPAYRLYWDVNRTSIASAIRGGLIVNHRIARLERRSTSQIQSTVPDSSVCPPSASPLLHSSKDLGDRPFNAVATQAWPASDDAGLHEIEVLSQLFASASTGWSQLHGTNAANPRLFCAYTVARSVSRIEALKIAGVPLLV